MVVLSAHLPRPISYPLLPRRVTWIKTKTEGVKNVYLEALRPGRLGLRCKANKCREAGTGDLGVLTSRETSQDFSFGDAGSTQTG